MKTLNNKRTTILVFVLLGLLIIGYKTLFVAPPDDFSVSENIIASERVEAILKQVEQIHFDMNVLTDPKFASLQSIEIPLLSLPVGKKNPFSASGSN